jgi:hypothetical protein
MDWFYDAQLRRYLTQFMRVMSNFGYKDAKGNVVKVPVRYGDTNRQVASIINKNSENSITSAPLIACYIKDLKFDRPRMQDPTFVSKLQIRERDVNGNTYLNTQGANYTVERIMPTPYTATFNADIWTTNLDQKLQLWEQIVVLFNPSLEIQTTDNYIDWTSLSLLELTDQVWSSRSIPQGVEDTIDIMTLTFVAPIWITPPAKIKKLGIITKIISNATILNNSEIRDNYSDVNSEIIFDEVDSKVIVTPGNFELLVLDNVATLVKPNGLGDDIDISLPENRVSWLKLLDKYSGKFKPGLSQLRLLKQDKNEIIAYITLNPNNESQMLLNIDSDTIPTNTIISGKGIIDAIVNPLTFNPSNKISGGRYLILENINVNDQFDEIGYDGPDAWKNSDNSDFQAYANDIIEWDGNSWDIVFDSSENNNTTYVTNSFTGVQYKWDGSSWSKSFEGVYSNELWRLIL